METFSFFKFTFVFCCQLLKTWNNYKSKHMTDTFFSAMAYWFFPVWGARRNQSMPRPSQTKSTYVRTFSRLPDFRAFIFSLLCLHKTFVRSCPDFRAFTRLSCVHQAFVCSCSFWTYLLSCWNWNWVVLFFDIMIISADKKLRNWPFCYFDLWRAASLRTDNFEDGENFSLFCLENWHQVSISVHLVSRNLN